MGHTEDIALADARRLIARAIDKAEDLAMRGAVAVIGAGGALVSASRMDHDGAGGWAGSFEGLDRRQPEIRSSEHLHRLAVIAPPIVTGFTVCSPEAVFPGAGGIPIERDGWVIGSIAASGAGIGPFVDYPGPAPRSQPARAPMGARTERPSDRGGATSRGADRRIDRRSPRRADSAGSDGRRADRVGDGIRGHRGPRRPRSSALAISSASATARPR